MLTRSMSIPRPQMSVETRMRCWKFLKASYLRCAACACARASSGRPSNAGARGRCLRVCACARERALLNSLLLRHRAVDGDRGEVALGEELVELDGALDRLDEDHHLVELERIKQVVELAVLLLLAQLDVVLLKPVQRQLAVVHVDLHRILHELLAHGAHLSRERSREHHHLLLVRRELEDVLHVLAHVELLEHLVALIEDEVLDLAEVEVLVARKRQHAPRRADEDVRRVRLEDLLVLGDGHATVEDARLDVGQVPGEPHKLVVDLEGQLARVAHHDHRRLCLFGLELVQHGQHKHGRLAHARLGLADHVHAQDGLRNALVLHL
mmetsp:Transcript_23196/g.59619  ORF Transcript_23196/g.59619 Transcript_23196/m.59619 type:complete len:325 (+) Transcript_23196:629-1603(+)